MAERLYILTGPSGVGKTSVAKELLAKRSNLKKVVTCTTRSIRDGEINGTSYHFLDETTFQSMIDGGEMFEWARVYDTLYGIRKIDVDKLHTQGNDVLFVVDVQGAKSIKKKKPEAVVLFLTAESTQAILKRIDKRDGGKTTNLDERQRAYEQEMAFGETCTYKIMNKTGAIDDTVEHIIKLMNSLDET